MARKKTETEPIQTKIVALRDAMRANLIERDDEIDLILTALICGENPLLVGPPGTAKSMLLDMLISAFGNGTRSFSVLVNKFTTPEELFGPISLQALKSDEFRRVTTHKMPEAHIAYVDEIFKASTAILNTMLRILNERQFHNGPETMACPIILCVASSNEWPSDSNGGRELGALFDRFLLRKAVHPIRSFEGIDRLLWADTIGSDAIPEIGIAEIGKASRECDRLPISDESKSVFAKIIEELRKKGIEPGDRRMRKSVRACKAYAYLSGASRVEPEALEILSHTLWNDPHEQPVEVAKTVVRLANPIGDAIRESLMLAADICLNNRPIDQVPKLKEVHVKLSALRQEKTPENMIGSLERALETIQAMLKKAYDEVVGHDQSKLPGAKFVAGCA